MRLPRSFAREKYFVQSVGELQALFQKIESWCIDDLVRVLEQSSPHRGLVISYAHCETMYLLAYRLKSRSVFQQTDHIYIDGVGAQIAMCMLDGRWRSRMTAEDYLEPVCKRLHDLNRRIAFIGSQQGMTEVAANSLSRTGTVENVLCLDGFGDVSDLTKLCETLRQGDVDVVFLGLGQPLQESLAHEISVRCPRTTIVCVGALFEQLQQNPPIARALRPLGLEWMVRLCREPRRLASRYLLHPWITASWIVKYQLRMLSGRA